MRAMSARRRRRTREAGSFRAALMALGRCEWCRRDSGPFDPHEIANGPLRSAAMDKPFAVILVCRECHDCLHRMAKQDAQRAALAVLRRSRPEDYDLTAFNVLVNINAPNRITPEEVAIWSRRLGFTTDRSVTQGEVFNAVLSSNVT